MRPGKFLLLLPAAVSVIMFHALQASAVTYNVVPDPTSVTSSDSGVYGLADAVELAEAGDTLLLADGIYTDQIHSYVSGEQGNPITISGGRDAIIKADSPSVKIEHSWITLEVSYRLMYIYASQISIMQGGYLTPDTKRERLVRHGFSLGKKGASCNNISQYLLAYSILRPIRRHYLSAYTIHVFTLLSNN